MHKRIVLGFAAALLAGTSLVTTAALATDQNSDVPGHARVNEVDQRLDNQQDRIQAGEKDGQMTPAQAARDEKHDAAVAGKEAKDEAKHNGHLTKKEQANLNRKLNKNSHHIHHQRKEGEKKEDGGK